MLKQFGARVKLHNQMSKQGRDFKQVWPNECLYNMKNAGIEHLICWNFNQICSRQTVLLLLYGTYVYA